MEYLTGVIAGKRLTLVFLMLILGVFDGWAQKEEEKGLNAITESAVKGQLEFLASDWTEGREVGTRGAYMAADYIASMFKVYGLEPYGDVEQKNPTQLQRIAGVGSSEETTYFQNFSLLEYSPGEEHLLSIVSTGEDRESSADFKYMTDFNVVPGTVGRSGKAPMVFAGYGYKDNKGTYDDLKELDVNGKIVVILAGYPGQNFPESEAYRKYFPVGRYAEYFHQRIKIERLVKAGAVAIIQVETRKDPMLAWAQNNIYPVKGDYYEADERLSDYYDTQMALPGDTLAFDIPIFTVSARVAGEIFSGSGISIDNFEASVAATMQPASKILPGKAASYKTTVNSKIVKARNVVGMIEGVKKDEYIVVGGHYDHVGKWNGWIWNGADDNASGTVGVMTIAKAFMATGKKPEKTVIFAAWTGEEKGLWGSRYFVKNAMKENKNIVLKLNYDMIGRDSDIDTLKNKATMTYTKDYSGIEEVTKKNIQKYGLNLDLNYRASINPSGGSDHAPFAQAGIPVFYFMAAMHPDYHLPSDELDKINWEKMVNIIKIGFLNTWNFANSNEHLVNKD